MNTVEEIKDKIKSILIDEIEIDLNLIVSPLGLPIEEMSIFDDFGIDSLALVDLVACLETEYNIQLRLIDFDNNKTINTISAMLYDRVNMKGESN